MTATAKNQKDRIVEMSRILGDLLQLGASIQSTDAEVLREIKRTNISLDAIVKMAKNATASHTGSFTEIILGLPTDTREKHCKSVFDMLDAGIQDIRSFQFILLPGTEAKRHGQPRAVQGRHRLPRAGPLLRDATTSMARRCRPPRSRKSCLGNSDHAARRLLRVPRVRPHRGDLQQRRRPEGVLPPGECARDPEVQGHRRIHELVRGPSGAADRTSMRSSGKAKAATSSSSRPSSSRSSTRPETMDAYCAATTASITSTRRGRRPFFGIFEQIATDRARGRHGRVGRAWDCSMRR